MRKNDIKETDLTRLGVSAVWQTDKPIFDDLTGEQIQSGYQVGIDGEIRGIFSFDSLFGEKNHPKIDFIMDGADGLYVRKIWSRAKEVSND